LKHYLMVTLGASDVQYAADGRRIEHFARECEEIAKLYEGQPELADDFVREIRLPILEKVVAKLYEAGRKLDRMFVIYTDQPIKHDKDTYWAYRVIKYAAEQTDYFRYRFDVCGIKVTQNPADLEDMFVLYRDICTETFLKEQGVTAQDALYACFTGGAPAMQVNMMQGFSSLQFPAVREYYYVPMIGGKSQEARKIRIAELLRHDDVMELLEQMLRSRQFSAAAELLQRLEFDSLRDIRNDVVHVVRALHQRFLLCFGDAEAHLNACKSELSKQSWFAELKRQTVSLRYGIAKLEDHDSKWLEDPDIQRVVEEYFHKVVFYWKKGLWVDFLISASSFYEWLLRVRLIHCIGAEYAKRKPDGQLWMDFLAASGASELRGATDQVRQKIPHYVKSDRIFSQEFLKIREADKPLLMAWIGKMNQLYMKRNQSVHNLQGANGNTIYDAVGRNWPEETRDMLKQDMGIAVQGDQIDRMIGQLIQYLKERRNRFFV